MKKKMIIMAVSSEGLGATFFWFQNFGMCQVGNEEEDALVKG